MMSTLIEPHLNLLSKTKQPFFVFSLNQITKKVESLRKHFPNIPIHYSIKTNPHKVIINHLAGLIEGFDLSTFQELQYLLRLGISPKKLMLSGPGKTNLCLKLAIENNVKAIHVDSVDEMRKIIELKRIHTNNSTQITLRIQTDDIFSNKLGLSESEINQIFSLEFPFLLSGLHCYLGRENFSRDKIKKLVFKMESIINKKKNCFIQNPTLFIGPGISRDLQEDEVRGDWKGNYSVEFEIGRHLVSTCGLYGAPVLSFKPTDSGSSYVIINGGLQHLGSPFIQSHRNLEPLKVAAIVNNQFIEYKGQLDWSESRLSGSLCLWHDILHPQVLVPNKLKRNDFLIFNNCGAYGLTAGIPHFIGQDLPLEFILDDNNNIIQIKSLEAISYHQGFEL